MRPGRLQPPGQILEDAPDAIPVPEALCHRRVEFILWPLDAEPTDPDASASDYDRTKVDQIVIPSREARNARR